MLSHLVLRKSQVRCDWKLRLPRTNGRKVVVNEIYPERETPAKKSEWEPGPVIGKTPVVITGPGGLEVATFTQAAVQKCHKHLHAIEIYTVLEGIMRIKVGKAARAKGQGQTLLLHAGDEVILFPNTPHEVLPEGTRFLARVHLVYC